MTRGRAGNLVNFVLIQGCWFVCVLGSARGSMIVGPAVVAASLLVHLTWFARSRRSESRLIAAAAALGFVIETLLRYAGVSEPAADVMPWPWSPLWLTALWALFGTAIPHSLSWLRGRYVVATLFGLIGGAAAYHGGARLGGVELTSAPLVSWGALGVAWGLSMPALVWLDARFVSGSRTEPGDRDSRSVLGVAA